MTTPAAWGAALGQREERARTPVQRFWWSEAPTIVAGLSDSKMRRNRATTAVKPCGGDWMTAIQPVLIGHWSVLFRLGAGG